MFSELTDCSDLQSSNLYIHKPTSLSEQLLHVKLKEAKLCSNVFNFPLIYVPESQKLYFRLSWVRL
jgi:hypothetical protein